MKILIIFLVSFISGFAHSKSFTFDSDLNGWGTWGNGIGAHDQELGNAKIGSVRLSADWGEAQTLHYNFGKLPAGLYKVSFNVRALDVQAHPDKSTFWHFYDLGHGTQDVFSDLLGTYDWRRVEYTVDVGSKELLMWFRLKSPGVVWVDDFKIEKVSGKKTSLQIEKAKKLVLKSKKRKNVTNSREVNLVDFNKSQPPHPFTVTTKENVKVGNVAKSKYYNFAAAKFLNGNWETFDRIKLSVFNGSKKFVEVFLTLGDERSNDYWSQQNHKTHLAPGWNEISFPLDQLLGERGSHRFQRSLNLKKITKWFIVIDPDNKDKSNSKFFIKDIGLSYTPFPEVPTKIWAYNFTSNKNTLDSGFINVTSKDYYNDERKYGFVNPKFWRVEDAIWASSLNRYSIGLLEGGFRIDLPNGRYQMAVNIERLGYWDVSFWGNREIYINDKIVLKEMRSSAKDYLSDYLIFENIIPTSKDHPYDLYLKKIFQQRSYSFEVKNGILNLSFLGDPTGINLNTLIIWKEADALVAKEYLNQVYERSKLEFDWMSRKISDPSVLPKSPEGLFPISKNLILKEDEVHKPLKESIRFNAGAGERPFELLQVRGEGEYSLDLIVDKEIANKIQILDVIQQYISPDLNHESYFLGGKYLKTNKGKIQLKKMKTSYLAIQLDTDGISPGKYSASIKLRNSKHEFNLPINISVLKYVLPVIEFPVGFFGPDPLQFNYVENIEFNSKRSALRKIALTRLATDGFTTFTGLPSDKLELKSLINFANNLQMSKSYFTYGGDFPFRLIEESKYEDIKSILSSIDAKVIHTFSDEAGGYSDKINEDVSFTKNLKVSLPSLIRSGFSSLGDSRLAELQKNLDVNFFSSISKDQIKSLPNNNSWGAYNAAPGNLDDPRFSFGPGLYFARNKGLSYYLEWHASAVNNYPYYDFDGRESDVTMFMPSSSGELYPTIRYLMAVEGIGVYRKLVLLEKQLGTNKQSSAYKWLDSIKKGNLSSVNNVLKSDSELNFEEFTQKLDSYLLETSSK